ncbi:MAG: tetratricopeptide repeat protein [Granulosicoccus sp.]
MTIKFRQALYGLLLIMTSLMFARAICADQSAPELPGLFDELLVAANQSESSSLEYRIWQLWLKAPDKNAGLLSSQLTLAMQGGELQLALRLADQLIDGNPDYAEAWNKRATIHYLQGDDDLSVADIRETLAREPRHFGAISGLGLIFMRQGDMEAALEAFEQVLAISPASENAKRSVERVKSELGQEI